MRRYAFVVFLGLGVQSCLVIPEIPHYRNDFPSRENMDQPIQEGFPHIGTSTREEILSKLGAPDEVSPDGTRLIYRWRKVVAEVVGPKFDFPIVSTYSLEIECDTSGVVSRCDQK